MIWNQMRRSLVGVLASTILLFDLSGISVNAKVVDNKKETSVASLTSLDTVNEGANPYTGLSYTHNEKFETRTISYGIDVSKYQGNIDWWRVKADGIDYAFVRAALRGYSTGNILDDTYFEQNMINANAAGIKLGAYFFSQATTVEEAIEEAEYLVNKVRPYTISMPLVIDFEYCSVGGRTGGRLYDADLSIQEATDVCMAFCQTVEQNGYTPMIYANRTMLQSHVDNEQLSSRYKTWLANYMTFNTYGGDYEFWQYSSRGKIDGISGNVDCNFWYMPGDELENPAPTISTSPSPTISPTVSPTVSPTPSPVVSEEPEQLPEMDPMKVEGLKRTAHTFSTISLSWSDIENASGYEIYRATTPTSKYEKIKTITSGKTTNYKVTRLLSGKEYYFKVRAFQNGETGTKFSAFSNVYMSPTTMYTKSLVAKDRTIMRATPSTKGKAVKLVAKGSSLRVIGYSYDIRKKLWYHAYYTVNGKKYSGYVYGDKMTVSEYGKTTAAVNVRRYAGTKYSILTNVPKDTRVKISSRKKDVYGFYWYHCRFTYRGRTISGYIHSNYVRKI